MLTGGFKKSRRNTFIAILLIAVVGAVIYSNVYKAPFVFDDLRQIEDKAKIRDLNNYLSPSVLFWPRPLTELTFALNYQFGGLDVFGYHLVNVAIHIINGWLAYFLAFLIFGQLCDRPMRSALNGVSEFTISWMSLFAALIFMSHPIQTQAVTYTAQRYTSMAATFYLLSTLCYIKARIIQRRTDAGRQRSKSRASLGFGPVALYVISLFCGVMAFLSKQNTASLPGVILLAEYVFFDRTWRGWKRKLLWFVPVVVLMGIFILYVSGIFRQGIQFGSLLEDVSVILRAPETYVGRWIYLCTQFNVIVIYIKLLFLPIGQNLDYMYAFKAGFFDGYTPLAFLFLVALAGISIWNLKKRPVLTFGILWFFITLSIESSIFPIKDALFEHRLYLPMFGFALVIAYMVFSLLPLKRMWCVVISVFVVTALGFASYVRNRTYNDRVTLWSDVATKSPKNYRAWYNLGNALRERGRFEGGVENYSRALSIKPNYTIAQDNLGVALIEKGQLEEAIELFSKALKNRPHDARIHCNMGTALMHQGKLDEAIEHFTTALRKRHNYLEAHNNLGIAFARKGDLEKAVRHFSKALHIEPQNPEIQNNLGFALLLQGKLQKSLDHLLEAVRLKPDHSEAHYRLGVTLTRIGDYDGAIQHFSKALQINPQFEQARFGLKKAVEFKRRKDFQ